MNWKKINLTLPKEILNAYESIRNIQKNTCIAGGFLSDLYMKKPYEDVDFFIKADDNKQQLIEKKLLDSGYKKIDSQGTDNPYKLAFHVETFQKDHWKIQLVFTDLGITHVKYFDFRFREFFYFNGQCYASDEALQDIKNKELVVGVPSYPLKTLYRIYSFKKRYDFSVNKDSVSRFSLLFNQQKYSMERITIFLNKQERKMASEVFNIIKKYNKADAEIVRLPTNLSNQDFPVRLIESLNMLPLERDLLERALTPRKFKLIDSFDFTEKHWDYLKSYRLKLLNKLKTDLTKQRIRFVSCGLSELYSSTRKFLNDLEIGRKVTTIPSNRTEYTKVDKRFSIAFFENLDYLYRFDRSYDKMTFKVKDPKVKVYDRYKFLRINKENDVKDYAKGNLILFDFPLLGNVSYNIRTKEIQDYGCYDPFAKPIEDFITEYYIKKTIS